MAPKISFSLLTIQLLFIVASASEHTQVGTAFGYTGPEGPENWGKIDPQYGACASGKMQSPINVVKKEAVLNHNFKPLIIDYVPSNSTLVNHRYNVGVVYDEKKNGGKLEIVGKIYSLKQMHWHCPSEHHIDGLQSPAELHLVHQTDSGAHAVVSVLYDYGDPDPFISEIQKNLDELAKQKFAGHEEAHVPLGDLDTKLLINNTNTRKYFRYIGSLTTPPCTENVIWTILGKVRTISKQQVEALQAPLDVAYKKNCRPLQSLNGRKVGLFDEFGT